MLDAVLEKYSVTPVTPAQNEVGQPEAAPLLGCTPVTPVTPQKNEMQAKWEKSDEPAPATDPLLITVYTPSGTPMTTRARDAEHAEWLRRMNPKLENPAPKPDLKTINLEDDTDE
jgi:hypothetical protein